MLIKTLHVHVDSERFEKKLKSHSVQLGQVSSIWISFCTWISFGNIWWQKPWETVWNMLSMMVLRRQDAIVTSRFSPAWEHAQPAYPILTSRGSQTVWLSSSKINEHCQNLSGLVMKVSCLQEAPSTILSLGSLSRKMEEKPSTKQQRASL